MKTLNPKKTLVKFTLTGFLLGFIVWFALILIEILLHRHSLNLESLRYLHIIGGIWYFIDTLPILGAITGFIFGKNIMKKMKQLEDFAQKEVEKTKIINEYTLQLSQGNYDIEILLKDEAGKALTHLRDSLKKSQEENLRHKLEEEHRRWASEGLTMFADVMRKNNESLETLAYSVISNLVKYLNANQGGFFVLNDDEENKKFFELKACYAYERRKFLEKTIEWGEGLIGACGLEMQPIFMTDVPEDYINITSGLGDANPRCIFIVPLIINNNLQGVIELASFKVFADYEREFVIKLAESIASTIYSVKNSIRMAKLLEQSERQAKELIYQEEQLRQNIEKLRITQEEVALQSQKFESFVNSVNHTMMKAEFNTNGVLLNANTKFLHKLGYQKNSEVEGKNVYQLIHEKDLDEFHKIWSNLAQGGRHFEGELKLVNKFMEDFWVMCTFVCMRNPDQSVEKILFLGTDINEQKKKNLDYEGQIKALDLASIKAEFMPNGKFILCNEIFMNELGYSLIELHDKSIFDLIVDDEVETYKTHWHNIINGQPFKGQIQLKCLNNQTKWYQATIVNVTDKYGEVQKVVFVANDITEQKLMEIETRRQAEQLKIQDEKLRSAQAELERKLEEARKEMKEQYREIETIKIRHEKTLEGALDAIITFNQAGYIQFFNKAAENMWGYSRSAVLRKHVKMLFPEHAAENDEFVSAIIKPGSKKPVGFRKEVKIKTANGEELSVLMLLSEAEVNNEFTYTAFIQTIEVELF